MKISQPLIALLSFTSAFGLMCCFNWSAGIKAPESPPASVAETSPLPIAVPAPSPTPSDPAGQLSAILALPSSQRDDEALQKLCKLLLPVDPEASFRAAMAQWNYDQVGLRAAAEALLKKDPAAARRLVAECPDLRSKRILEGVIMADEVSRNPREKLRWADETLEGVVNRTAVAAGAARFGQTGSSSSFGSRGRVAA